MQAALRDAGFYRGPITGDFDRTTETAVITFHKFIDVQRNGTFNALDWLRIQRLPEPDIPYRWDEPDRVEIDTTRQLLYVIRNHQIAGILPTSTGSGATYFSVRQGRDVRSATPHGDFELYWRQYGWNCDTTTGWCVYNY
jgi:peptidoglycan hydrolase-like protein with peptidoglycan-binding domain